MSLVLDASMAISWLFDDEQSDAGDEILARIVREGAMVPSLWRLEVANMLRNAVRRKRCDQAFADRALARLERLTITIDEKTDRQAWTSTWALSQEHGLTTYDASYLDLALRTGLPLASLDRDLLAAASRVSLEVLTA